MWQMFGGESSIHSFLKIVGLKFVNPKLHHNLTAKEQESVARLSLEVLLWGHFLVNNAPASLRIVESPQMWV